VRDFPCVDATIRLASTATLTRDTLPRRRTDLLREYRESQRISLDRGAQTPHGVLENAPNQGLLGREVVVQRRKVHAHRRCHIAGAETLESALCKLVVAGLNEGYTTGRFTSRLALPACMLRPHGGCGGNRRSRAEAAPDAHERGVPASSHRRHIRGVGQIDDRPGAVARREPDGWRAAARAVSRESWHGGYRRFTLGGSNPNNPNSSSRESSVSRRSDTSSITLSKSCCF